MNTSLGNEKETRKTMPPIHTSKLACKACRLRWDEGGIDELATKRRLGLVEGLGVASGLKVIVTPRELLENAVREIRGRGVTDRVGP